MLLLLFITTKFDLMYLLFYMPSIVRLVTSGGGKWHSAAQTTIMSSRMGTRLIGTVFFRMTTTSFVHLPAQHGFWHWPLSLFWQSFCCLLLPARAGRRYFKFGTAHEEFTVDSEASISKNDVSWVDLLFLPTAIRQETDHSIWSNTNNLAVLFLVIWPG